jgi:hypothetical protein
MHSNNLKEKSIVKDDFSLSFFLQFDHLFLINRNGERGETEFYERKCLNLSTMRMTYEARVSY